MFSRKTKIYILISTAIVLTVLFSIAKLLSDKNTNIDEDELVNVKIAACPSMLEFLEGKKLDNISIIKTANTATSLQLLSSGRVDYILSGRPLKPDEGDYQQIFLNKNGYSFLSSFDDYVFFNDLQEVEVYTDQSLSEIETNLNLKKLIFIDDVYSRPEPSFAISSWDNTDYSRTNILQVLNPDNTRYNLSRTPILYCDKCQQAFIDLLSKD